MKIGFIYNAPCNILEISQNPESTAAAAVCFLAMQLAKLGHDITIFSYGGNADIFNVRCRHIEIKNQALALDPALLEKDFAVIIFKDTSPEFALSIKNVLPYQPKIYLWTELDLQAPLNRGLANANLVAQLTGIVCVSYWQRTTLIDAYNLPEKKVMVVKYAIAPMFEDMFIDGKEFVQIKAKAPRIAYIAKQEDGLDILLDSFYDIGENYTDASLGIFTAVTDPELQSRIQNLRGVTVYGLLPKMQIATWLRNYTIFANPSTILSTYNINILEAMAAGLYPITSDTGSSADYCHGHGITVPADLLRSSSLDNYISELLAICQAQLHQSSDFYDYCFKQTVDMNKKHTWRVRAKEWVDVLQIPL